jgi:hypothetical protein
MLVVNEYEFVLSTPPRNTQSTKHLADNLDAIEDKF